MLNLSVRSSSTTSSVPFDEARVELSPFAIAFLQREVEEHRGAAAFFAVDHDRTAVLLHDGLRDAEPEPRARGLGGEERIEQLGQRAARDADASVDDAHLLHLEPAGCAAALAAVVPAPPPVARAAVVRAPAAAARTGAGW